MYADAYEPPPPSSHLKYLHFCTLHIYTVVE